MAAITSGNLTSERAKLCAAAANVNQETIAYYYNPIIMCSAAIDDCVYVCV